MNKFKKISQTQYLLDGVDKYCNYDEIKMPARATKGSAGYDIFALADISLGPAETVKLPTGLSVTTDSDKFLAIVPRSGLGFKYFCQLWNTLGVIDSDYHEADNEGHMWVKLFNNSTQTMEVKKGQAFCQALLLPCFRMDDDIEPEETRTGGFGSTTK